MSFDRILSDLESGKISAEQAKELIAELLQTTRNSCIATGQGDRKKWFECGVDCVISYFGLKEATA